MKMKKHRLLEDCTFMGYKILAKGQIVYEMPEYSGDPQKMIICTDTSMFGSQTTIPRNLAEAV